MRSRGGMWCRLRGPEDRRERGWTLIWSFGLPFDDRPMVCGARVEVSGPVALDVGGPFLGGVDVDAEQIGEDGDGEFTGEGDEGGVATGVGVDAVLPE